MLSRLLVDSSLLFSGAALGTAFLLKAGHLAVGRHPILLGMGPSDFLWAATLGLLFAIAIGIRVLLLRGEPARVSRATVLPRRRRGRGWIAQPEPLADAPPPGEVAGQKPALGDDPTPPPPAENATQRRARLRIVDPGGSFL